MATAIYIEDSTTKNKKIVTKISKLFSFYENFKLFKAPEKLTVWMHENKNPNIVYLPFRTGKDFSNKLKSTKNLNEINLDINSLELESKDSNVNNPIPYITSKYFDLSESVGILTDSSILTKQLPIQPISNSDFENSLIQNNSITKADFKFSGDLRKYQENFYEEISKRNILTESIPCALVDVFPGFGKTIVGSKSSSDIGLLTCVLTPLKFLEKSWVNVYKNLTDARVWIVGDSKSTKEYDELWQNLENIIDSHDEAKKQLKTNDKIKYWTTNGYSNIYVPDVIICMVERVDSIPTEIIHRIGTLIIDEAHMFCTSKRIEQIFKFLPKYVIALTATPIRSDGRNKFLDYLVGNDCQITRLPPPYKIIRIKTGLKYSIPKKAMYNTKTHEYMDANDFGSYLSLIQNDKKRNEMIAKICRKLIQYDRKIILMCRFKEHVKNISEQLNDYKIQNDYVMGTKAKYKDSSVLLGTMSKMGTGFDEANVCEDFKGVKSDTLILTSSVKETSQLYQLMGRVFRSDNPLIIFLHDEFEVCDKHWAMNKKLLKEHDTTIEELNIKDFL
jgi:superfamily II DNA or RNA helicase